MGVRNLWKQTASSKLIMFRIYTWLTWPNEYEEWFKLDFLRIPPRTAQTANKTIALLMQQVITRNSKTLVTLMTIISISHTHVCRSRQLNTSKQTKQGETPPKDRASHLTLDPNQDRMNRWECQKCDTPISKSPKSLQLCYPERRDDRDEESPQMHQHLPQQTSLSLGWLEMRWLPSIIRPTVRTRTENPPH